MHLHLVRILRQPDGDHVGRHGLVQAAADGAVGADDARCRFSNSDMGSQGFECEEGEKTRREKGGTARMGDAQR